MMESIVLKNTSVREFKKQIIEEAKVQGIDCVLELDKYEYIMLLSCDFLCRMRLREKWGMSASNLFLDDQFIHASGGIYLELLKRQCISKFLLCIVYCTLSYVFHLLGPEKKKHDRQRQVYVIRWRPSQFSVDPTEEIIVDNNYDPKHVIEKVIPLKYM